MLSSFLTFLLFCTVLSTDTFAAGLSYGSTGVKVPLPSKLILAFVSGLMFTLSVFLSVFLASHFPERAALFLSFLILLALSLYKGYDALSCINPSVRKNSGETADPLTTDFLSRKINHAEPSILSAKEALLLSLVLSLDSLTAGAGYQLQFLSPFSVLLLSSLIHFLSLSLGLVLSRRLFQKGSCILSFLPALFFFVLAISRLFKFLQG